MNNDIIIDVGANCGLFTFPMAINNPEKKIFAYEPIPKLLDYLASEIANGKHENVVLRDIALSNKEGNSILNISKELDCGISSLLKLNDSNIMKNEYWKLRTDLKYDSSIPILITRLDTELNNIDFGRINFIKIDSQGLDVEILSSLGEYMNRLDAGMIEVPAVLSTSLYKDEEYDLNKAITFLNEHGFEVYKIKPNDECSNEFNIFFKCKSVDINALELKLSLDKIDIYNGRDFWHLPSSKLTDYRTEMHTLKTEIHFLKTKMHSLLSK